MKNKKNLSQDDLRQKVDGFSLENKNSNIEENRYKTTDQGVYYPPDDTYNDIQKAKKPEQQ
jgi:hypothetical protein